MCKNWQQSEKCPYGPRCLFAHGAKEMRSYSVNSTAITSACSSSCDCKTIIRHSLNLVQVTRTSILHIGALPNLHASTLQLRCWQFNWWARGGFSNTRKEASVRNFFNWAVYSFPVLQCHNLLSWDALSAGRWRTRNLFHFCHCSASHCSAILFSEGSSYPAAALYSVCYTPLIAPKLRPKTDQQGCLLGRWEHFIMAKDHTFFLGTIFLLTLGPKVRLGGPLRGGWILWVCLDTH